MNIIEPTPSQAAVVLQRFLKQQGCELKLSTAQEALARSKGYASWQALASDLPVRGERGKSKPAAPPTTKTADILPIQHFIEAALRIEQVGPTEREELNEQLAQDLAKELANTGLLEGWRRQFGRDECYWLESEGPYIQVSYDRRMNQHFGTELVFTLRDYELKCYVRTWEFKDQLKPSADYAIFDECSGDFDTDARTPEVEERLTSLVVAAQEEAERHKLQLQDCVNVR